MGRKRKKKHSELPKNVYADRGGRYRGFVYDSKTQKTKMVAKGRSPEETEYNLNVARNGHHWVNMPEDYKDHFGFIYLITNRKTGKKYLGCKQFEYWDGPSGGYKEEDKRSPYYNKDAWKPGGWEFYTGSSVPVNAEIGQGSIWDFTYEILELCDDRLDLHIAEISHHVSEDVLYAKGEDGEYLYYNMNIAGKAFRCPYDKDSQLILQAKTAKEVHRYYLKPELRADGSIVPFEDRRVTPQSSFQDIRETIGG